MGESCVEKNPDEIPCLLWYLAFLLVKDDFSLEDSEWSSVWCLFTVILNQTMTFSLYSSVRIPVWTHSGPTTLGMNSVNLWKEWSSWRWRVCSGMNCEDPQPSKELCFLYEAFMNSLNVVSSFHREISQVEGTPWKSHMLRLLKCGLSQEENHIITTQVLFDLSTSWSVTQFLENSEDNNDYWKYSKLRIITKLQHKHY